MSAAKPKIVCICGSSRFCDIAAVYAWKFEKEGKLALSMHLLPEWYAEETQKKERHHFAEQEGVRAVLDELHLRKIDLADEVFVINKGGYIGERTRIEIDYAREHGKPVSYLELVGADLLSMTHREEQARSDFRSTRFKESPLIRKALEQFKSEITPNPGEVTPCLLCPMGSGQTCIYPEDYANCRADCERLVAEKPTLKPA